MQRGDVWLSRTGFKWVVDVVWTADDGTEVILLRTLRHGTIMNRRWTEKGLRATGATPTGERLSEADMEARARK